MGAGKSSMLSLASNLTITASVLLCDTAAYFLHVHDSGAHV